MVWNSKKIARQNRQPGEELFLLFFEERSKTDKLLHQKIQSEKSEVNRWRYVDKKADDHLWWRRSWEVGNQKLEGIYEWQK